MITNWIFRMGFTVAVSLCCMLAATPVFGQVVINEIDYDQPGTDFFEFIELKNTGVSAVSLDTFYLELYNGVSESVYSLIDLPDSILAPGEYFVICGDADSVTTCDFATGTSSNLIQNAGTDPDAVALFSVTPNTTTVPVGSNPGVAYLFGGILPNPNIPVRRGETYVANLTATGDPLWIKTAPTTGTGDQYNDGVSNNGTANGTITFTVPFDAPDTLYYQSENSAAMGGLFLISNTYSDAVSYDGSVTNPNFVEGTGFTGIDSDANDFSGISRFPDGADTDDNDTDFSIRCITPGAANSVDNTGCPNPYLLSSNLSNPTACNVGLAIPDNGCGTDSLVVPIEVTGAVGTQLGVDILLSEVDIIIEHTWDSDVTLYLRSPNGVDVMLTDGNGGSGDNYGDPSNCPTDVTTFSMGASTAIGSGTAPFIGAFTPDGDFADFEDGSDPNGVWELIICDGASGDTGGFEYAELKFAVPPSCPPVTDLTSSNVGATTATLSWTSSDNDTSYIVAYDTTGADIVDLRFLSTTSDTFVNITGLDELTAYDFYVAGVCGTNSGDTTLVGPETFTTSFSNLSNPTACNLGLSIPDDACGTDSLVIPIEVTGAVGTQLGVDVLLSEVDIIIEHTWSGDVDLYLRSPNGVDVLLTSGNGSSGDNYGDPSNCPTDVTTFSMGASTGVGSGTAPFIGSYVPAGDFADFEDGSDPNGVWQLIVCDDGFGDTGEFEYAELKFVAPPTCSAPTALSSQDITSNSATALWTAGTGAVSYIVEYDTAGFTLGDGIVSTTTDTFFNLSSLNSNTDYDFYVAQVCGTNPGDTTAAIGPESFQTLCSTFAFPFLEDFESGSSSLSCWTQNGIGAGWLTTTSRSNSGNQSFFHDDNSGAQADTLFSPSIDLSGSVSPELSFFENGNFIGSTDVHEVLISSDGGSTWSLLYSLDATEDTWTEVVLDVSGFAGQTIQVAFYYEGNFSDEWYLDDFELREAPTCADPSALSSQDITENSATLFWTAGNGAQSFIVEYDTTGFTLGDGNLVATNDTFALLSSLDGNTEYDFYVSQVCGNNPGDTTSAVGPESFTTACGVIAAPYLENFDGTNWVSGTGFSNTGDAIDPCWSRNPLTSSDFFWGTRTGSTGSSSTGPDADNTTGSGNYLYTEGSNGSTGDFADLFTPQIDLSPLTTPQLLFAYHFYGSDIDSFDVSVNAGLGWVSIDTIVGAQQGDELDPWLIRELDLSSFASSTIQVRFRAYKGGSFADYAIDDFWIRETPSCIAPSNLTSQDITAREANVNWVTGGGAISYIVEYDTAGFSLGTGNVLTTTDTFVDLSSLVPLTDYDVYVTQVCGTNSGDTSFVTGPESFTTLVACDVPTALASQNITQSDAVVSWTSASGSASFIVEYDTAGFTSGTGIIVTTADTFLTLSSLSAGTAYDFYVVQVCGTLVGDSSLSVGPASFSTLCAPFLAPFTENFDGADWIAGTGFSNTGDAIDPCWSRNPLTSSDYFWGTRTGSTGSGSTGPDADNTTGSGNYVFTEASNGSTGDFADLFTPQIDLSPLTTPQLLFAYHFYGSGIDSFDVSVNAGLGWVSIDTIVGAQQGDELDPWLIRELDLSAFAGNAIQVRFRGYKGGSFADYAIDDVVIRETPLCSAPTDLSSQDITENSATAFWTGASGAVSYIVEYDTAGFTLGNGNFVTTTDTFDLLSSLDANTTYDFYVTQVCGTNPGDTSIASGPESFTTACGVFAFPFLDDLEAGSSSLSCWTQNGIGAGWLTTTARSNSGSQSFFHNDDSGAQADTLFSPRVDLSTAIDPELSFFENGNFVSFADSHQVIISIDGGLTWDLLYTDLPVEDEWNEVIIDLSAYVGQTVTVGFYYQGDFSDAWYIDDFELRETPQCPPVTALTATNITETSAILSWTSGTGNDTTYIVGYDLAGTPLNVLGNFATTTDTFLNITGLMGSTAYDFYVAGICGENPGDTTIVGPSTFNTPIANDDCSGALVLCAGDTLTNQTATGATQSLPGVTCNGFTGTADDDVWYKFIARSTNPRIVLVGATGYDAVLELLSGSCGSTTNLDCADNTFGGGTEIINAVGLTVGEVYYVRAYDWSTGIPTGSFDIFIEDASFATVTPERDTVCVGGTATFTASGGDTYLWGSGETTASITTPAVTSLTEFIVTVTDSFGCLSVDTAVADVYPAPAVSAGMNDTICLGDTTTLTATGAGTFSWNTGGSTASIEVSPSVTTEYVVTLTGSTNGCANTDTVLVVIDTLPGAVLPDTAFVCAGSNATLDAGNPGSSYLWSTSDISQTISVSSANAGLYTVEITNSQGCVTNDTSLVQLTASVPVTLQDYTICEGDTQVLDAGNPGKDFLWSTGETTQTIGVTLAGLYDVTVTDPLAGCSGVDTSIITVNPAPPADAGNDETICEGSDVTLTATGGDSYSWTSGDNTASTTVAPIVTTDYIVTVTENVNNCSATDTLTVNVNPAPPANAGINDTICVGETSTFTATGGDSYAWSTGSNFDTTIVSPLTTTEYVVTVTENTNNCTATDTVLSVVNPLPVADAGVNDTICLDESSTLTATGGVDYSWSSGDNTASTTVTPIADTEYRVTVTDVNGCVNTDTVDVVVNVLPTADAGSDETICEGTTTTLTATGGVSYSWTSGDNTASTDVSPVTDTEFIVTVTDTNGCADTDTVDVFVNAAPPADAGMNDTICVGETSTFTATGGDSYAWSTGSNFDTTVVSPLTTTEYVVTVTENVNNCSATDTVLSVVDALPIADAGMNDTICVGESSTLMATGGTSYSWSSGANTDTTTVSPSTDTEYIVTVTDANACVNTDTVDVVVNALPVADAGADQTICLNDAATLTATGGTDYEWSNGDLTAVTAVAPSTATEYSVTVTDANSCSSADTVEVFVNPLPTADAGVDTNVCAGSSVTLTASGGTSYVWSSGDSTVSTSVSPLVDTDYTVVATDGNGCSDVDTVNVEVLELPIVRFVQLDSVYCIGDGNVQLVASPPGGTFSGTGVSGTNLDLTAVGAGDTAVVTFSFEALNGCVNSVTREVFVDPCTAIDEIEFLNTVQLMPNPFTDRLIMAFNSEKESKVMITMTDVSGKQVWAENKQILSGRNTFEISSGAQLAEGMYFITISNADKAMTYKVIKSK